MPMSNIKRRHYQVIFSSKRGIDPRSHSQSWRGSGPGLEKPGTGESPGSHKCQFMEGTGVTRYIVKLGPFGKIVRQIQRLFRFWKGFTLAPLKVWPLWRSEIFLFFQGYFYFLFCPFRKIVVKSGDFSVWDLPWGDRVLAPLPIGVFGKLFHFVLFFS